MSCAVGSDEGYVLKPRIAPSWGQNLAMRWVQHLVPMIYLVQMMYLVSVMVERI